jgi:hypothetical protein
MNDPGGSDLLDRDDFGSDHVQIIAVGWQESIGKNRWPRIDGQESMAKNRLARIGGADCSGKQDPFCRLPFVA